MNSVKKSLKQIFGDVNYAWQLLECEIKFQLSSNITGEDISHMLQLYMRGVQKMNSNVDIRESFFKNRVTSLMSRPAVIKILNKPMSKKNQAPVIQTIPTKKVDNKTQIHLQQKRREMQMRLAYGAQEHNADNLRKLLAQQSQKQSFLTTKIDKIVDDHQQRLMKRVRQRKLRTMTAKSKPDIYMRKAKEIMEKQRDQEQFGKIIQAIQEQTEKKRKAKSLQPKKSSYQQQQQQPAPTRRRGATVDLRHLKPQQSPKK